MKLKWPSGKELGNPPGAIGMQLTTDTTRAGVVDDGNVAWPERIVEARRQWTQADVADFEPVGKRRWRDRGSGTVYREETGAPLLAGTGSESTRFISPFFVLDGSLHFLTNDAIPQGSVVHHGPIISRQLSNPGGPPAEAVIH